MSKVARFISIDPLLQDNTFVPSANMTYTSFNCLAVFTSLLASIVTASPIITHEFKVGDRYVFAVGFAGQRAVF